MVQLVASVYQGPGKDGDFGWMCNQQPYERALFVFNDNEAEFRHHHDGHPGGARCHKGGGNAAIRPWQDRDPPRATGIPTGSHGGFPHLDDHARSVIDTALADLRALLATGRYDTVVYSAAGPSGDLGTGIFTVGHDVRAYIVAGLRAAVAEAEGGSRTT